MKFSEMPYKRIAIDDIKKEFNKIIEMQENAKSKDEAFKIHEDYYKLSSDFMTNFTIAHIRHDIDTTDKFYDDENTYYDEIRPIIENYTLKYHMALYNSKFKNDLKKIIGEVLFKNIELEMKSMDEKLIPLMQEENALTTKYAKLLASAKIPFEGEIYNLSLMNKFTTSNDRKVRIKAYEAKAKFFTDNQQELDNLYDELVKNRTKQAKMMGYDNFVELGYYRMNRNSYDEKMVENFRKQVKKYLVPYISKMEEKRKKDIGVDKLTIADKDIYFKDGNPKPIGSPQEILQSGKEMYSQLSPETKEFFDFMSENELFDVLGRKNKKTGGYMTYLLNYKSPFIFANFNGTSGDVEVITHECGHAFQGYLMREDPILEHADITMETAEVHSMSMEFFTKSWMNNFFGDRAEDFKYMHKASSIAFIPYGCMVDEFQHEVYKNPDISPLERRKLWMKLEKVYMPMLDYDDMPFYSTGGIWQRQAHIYEMPFYYIDYCLAQICALQFNVLMNKDYDDAWKKYLIFAKLGAKGFFTDMLKLVDLKSPFEDGCIKWIVDNI